MVRRISKRKVGDSDHRIMHPERDWIIGLGIATIFFVVGVLYTGYEFVTHLKETETSISVQSSVVQYDQESVADVLERYGALKEKFESLRADKSNVVLPLDQNITPTTSEAVDTKEATAPGTASTEGPVSE